MQLNRIIMISAFVSLLALSIYAQTPPPQPADGPGGSNYSHGSMVMTRYGTVLEDTYWKFEPADPVPDSAHVIVHFHGHATQATLEEFCGEKTGEWFWVKHLVRKGYVVLYPGYQCGAGMLSNQQIATLLRNAFAEMGTAKIKPCHTANGGVSYGLMGYSQGGLIGGLANSYASLNLPAPKALFFVTAAGGGNMGNLPLDTKVFLLEADKDMAAILPSMQSLWSGLSKIPFSNRNFVMVMSDSKGSTTCTADHSLCLTGQTQNSFMLNALDYYGVWKFSTAIMNYAFHGTDAKYCIGAGTDVTFMGLWSNSEPFKPAQIMDSAVAGIGRDIPVTAKTVPGVAVTAGRSGFRVESPACALRDIAVFDTRGRLVAHYDNIFARSATMVGLERYQTVCLRMRLTNNTVVVRKIYGGR